MLQLFSKAKCVIPAVRNYLFFNSSQVAVIYFGKRLENHVKVGITSGAEDLKVKLIRFLTSEIWPPLLRTDAPDESLGTEITNQLDHTPHPVSAAARQQAEDLQEQEWVKRSLESSMEVLLYLKQASNGTKYLKVILHNNTQRIHFDIVDYREEKFRWELRKLYTRIMDNLESQRAVDSYESYSSFFRWACEMASTHALDLERPSQKMLKASILCLPNSNTSQNQHADPWTNTITPLSMSPLPACATYFDLPFSPVTSPLGSTPGSVSPGPHNYFHPDLRVTPPTHQSGVVYEACGDRYYNWMESLEKPESATLDYKSYMSRPAQEIIHRSVKFMCGFLNAYRSGKLVIGVHEIPHRSTSAPKMSAKREGRNQILLHNDLVDQFVVGVRITEAELEVIQLDVSRQLLNCVPPIPPSCVRIDLVPVKFADDITFSSRMLVFFDAHSSPYTTLDAMKQKCNSAIRNLTPLGLSLVPAGLDLRSTQELLRDAPEYEYQDDDLSDLVAEVFLIASIDDPKALTATDWEQGVLRAVGASGKRCEAAIVDCPPRFSRLSLPPVYVVEVSIDLKDCGYLPLIHYKGKFFSGWPSIPIWDPVEQKVRRMERNYELWSVSTHSSAASSPLTMGCSTSDTMFPSSPRPKKISYGDGNPMTVDAASDDRPSFQWHKQRQILHRVLDFLWTSFSPNDALEFRLVHPLCNAVFENFQGAHLVKMIRRTPVGVPLLPMEWKVISRMQQSLQLSGIPPMPLLMCRVYELLGNLPPPFPFVSVPLQQQSFRLSPHLLPLFYNQFYFDGTMRAAVVLDLRDFLVKTVQLRCGSVALEHIGGVGFEPITNVKSLLQMIRSEPKPKGSPGMPAQDAAGLTPAFQRALLGKRHIEKCSLSFSLLGESPLSVEREVEGKYPILSFRFIPLASANTASPKSGGDSLKVHGKPWSLASLLNWLRGLLIDSKHAYFFGYCNRSLAFRFLRLQDICSSHLSPTAITRLQAEGVEFAKEENCLLHRRMKKWATNS